MSKFDFVNWKVFKLENAVESDKCKLQEFPLQCNGFCKEEANNTNKNDNEFILDPSDTDDCFDFIVILETKYVANGINQRWIWKGYLYIHKYVVDTLEYAYRKGTISFSAEKTSETIHIFVNLNPSAFGNYLNQNEKLFATNDPLTTMFRTLKPVFQYFFPLKDDTVQYSSEGVETKELADLYAYVKKSHNSISKVPQNKYQHHCLRPSLRDYQVDAVNWMVFRENIALFETGNEKDLHPLWEEIVCLDGSKIYLNCYNGGLTKQRFSVDALPKGGILADEMGLGKTVEVLACILNNPCHMKFTLNNYMEKLDIENAKQIKDEDHVGCPSKKIKIENDFVGEKFCSKFHCIVCGDQTKEMLKTCKIKCFQCCNVFHKSCSGYLKSTVNKYKCPKCATKGVIDSHCTLIVCPDALLMQWVCEIKKHIETGSLKYMIYKGVHQDFIQPVVLATHDVILTTFNTLRYDFNYMLAEKADRKLRHKKRYNVLPCPLLPINFWRVCVDEAQMVETNGTKVFQMMMKISAVNRWCVSGTPLQRNIEDVCGFLSFLNVKPYTSYLWCKRALFDHYRAGNHTKLFNLISKLMWRNMKCDVDIGVPKQTQYVTWLQFSAVEFHYYQKEQERCVEQTHPILTSHIDHTLKLGELLQNTLVKVMKPLFSLRQACCHHSLVRNSNLSMSTSMEMLLVRLIVGTKLECEEEHRKFICAMNGIAGIEILMGNKEAAVQCYKACIDSWTVQSDFKTDSLQKLHTLHNLCEVSTLCNQEVMKVEIEQLRNAYHRNVNTIVEAKEISLQEAKEEVQNAENKIKLKSSWWHQVVDFAVQLNLNDNLLVKVNSEMAGVNAPTVFCNFNSLDGLKMTLYNAHNKFQLLHEQIYAELSQLSPPPNVALMKEVTLCCIAENKDVGTGSCSYCQLENKITTFEAMLFSQTQHGVTGNTTGFRAQSYVERLLQILLTWARNQSITEYVIEQGKDFMVCRNSLKKEFKSMRATFLAYHQRVQSLDELDMCMTRFTLQVEGDIERKHTVREDQLVSMRMTLESDKLGALCELSRKQGQLTYLKNLEKTLEENDGFNSQCCPICDMKLGIEWAVFKCGHCVCCQCVVELQNVSSNVRYIKCPLCRAATPRCDVTHVSTKSKQNVGFDSQIKLRGNYSTKIEAVMRRLLWIKEGNPNDKTLVFSAWVDVLALLSRALVENEISHNLLEGSKVKFQSNLQAFKESPDVNVLLLPLRLGSKGLNIIEASHVVLVEPSLNMRDEEQAIGRVHRIGQTKFTYVHRFFIKNTVEERIHNLMQSNHHDDRGTDMFTLAEVQSLIS